VSLFVSSVLPQFPVGIFEEFCKIELTLERVLVKDVVIDVAKDLVKVAGTMDATALQAYLWDKLSRLVEVVTPNKKDKGDKKRDVGDEKKKDKSALSVTLEPWPTPACTRCRRTSATCRTIRPMEGTTVHRRLCPQPTATRAPLRPLARRPPAFWITGWNSSFWIDTHIHCAGPKEGNESPKNASSIGDSLTTK
jgi:hypothetical protein